MSDPNKEITQLQEEMDAARQEAKKQSKGEVLAQTATRLQNTSLDYVITGAGMLVVLGLAVSFSSQLTRDQVTALTAGSIGGAGGLVIGYSIGRRKAR